MSALPLHISTYTSVPLVPASPPDVPSLSVGAHVGRYEIIRPLGVGGSADVFEAEHVDLGRRVALKILRCAHDDSDEIFERFRREARTSGTLQHPNIADVFDVGYTEEGSPYLVMELLKGESLDAWIARAPLTFAAAIEVGAQLADALAFVHANGILHRDVKPANVVLHRERDGRTVAKLVDFGISKPVTQAPADRAITREGLVVGTPHYMAPEYLGGGPANEGTDSYAVGVSLYESLAGRPPFDDDNMSGLVAKILRDEAQPVTDFRPDCPKSLGALVARAMHRDVSRRFKSAAELGRELRRVGAELGLELGSSALEGARTSEELTGELLVKRGLALTERPLSTPPTPKLGRPRPPRRVVRLGAVAAAILALAGGTGFVALTVRQMSIDTPAQAHASVLARPLVAQAAHDTKHARVLAVTPVAVPPPPTEPSSTARAPIAPAGSEPSPSALPRAIRVAHAQNAEVTAAPPRAPSPPAEQAARQSVSDASREAARDLTRRALSTYAGGQFPRALALYREAVRRDPTAVDAWRGLGAVSARMGQPTDARHAFGKYLQLAPHAADAGRVRAALDALPR